MQCNINNVKRICGYNQAARYFEETKKPRSAKWADDERPLYNTRSHHYRILKGNDNGVPFYVALPSPTIDFSVTDGVAEIPIEERDPR